MVSYGQHPMSDYMVSDGKAIYALSTLDIIIDINGMFFRCRSLSHAKNLNISEEFGTGGLDPYALVNQEQSYSGSLSYASFLVDGTPVMIAQEKLALQKALLKPEDEGRATYFHIYTIEVPGRGENATANANNYVGGEEILNIFGQQAQSGTPLNFIEAMMNCKVTKFNRDYADKGTIVSSIDFKYMYGIPK